MLHRFPTGLSGEKVHQKRVPAGAPSWLETVRLHFPRYGLHADELCVTELAAVIWAVQMSTVEFHPWNSRRSRCGEAGRVADRPRPDAGLPARHGPAGRRRRPRGARRARRGRLAEDVGRQRDAHLRAHRAVHGFTDVRAAALAFAREVERRAPETSRPPGGARTGTRRRCSWTTTRTPVITRWRPRTRSVACRRPPCPRR